MRVRFGECVLDSDSRELFHREKLVHVLPKAFQLLELLLAKRPRALSKQEIHDVVWPGTFVSEATLARAISDIRAAIGEEGREAGSIRTVHGFGYAFSAAAIDATVTAAPAGPSCYLIWEDRVITLATGNNLLGRAEDAGVRINDPSVSRHHARIVLHDRATLEDLGSKNGTFVRDSRITQPTRLMNGDAIRLGEIDLTVRLVSADDTTKTVEHPDRARRKAPSQPNSQDRTATAKRRSPR
jgi:DNA-binding winged helix-turn-helix (wHTH) protein